MYRRFWFLFLIPVLWWTGCAQEQLSAGKDCGTIENKDINEASGMVASRAYQGVLWVHNDSGDRSRLFAIDDRGGYLGTIELPDIDARDWEDIALGPGPQPETDYLYIAEIGDNRARYEYKYIYRLAEPEVNIDSAFGTKTVHQVDRMTFVYPDGPRDAETLLCDPLSGDLYVVSKREEQVHVYRMTFIPDDGTIHQPQLVSILDVTQITGGDVSPSGKGILLKNYQTVYFWRRDPQLPLYKAFDEAPRILPYREEPQGEAITWQSSATGYFTLSEVKNRQPAHLYFYQAPPDLY